MTKTIVCDECNGFGYVNRYDENHAWTETCGACRGAGVIRVSMTNADRIRSMSDEELAELFCGFCANTEECNECQLYSKGCAESIKLCDWRRWMNESAEG